MIFQAILESVKTRKDRTYSVNFGSQELPATEVAQLMSMSQEECVVVVIPNNPIILERIIKALNEEKR